LDLTRDTDDTAVKLAIAKTNTRLLQVAAIEDEIADANSLTEEADRTALLSLCDMDATELQMYTKMLEVYDKARSHFLFEIVELQVKKYLNAERLKAEADQPTRILSYAEYKEQYLQRTQNSELTQDLLSFILKPREEGCPIYLWAAERISESNLLTANGLAMSDQAWLAYTLAFITPEERQILDVPSLAERALYDNGRGYTLADLEEAITVMDVTTLKRFRQNVCNDPVVIQILGLSKAKDGSSSVAPNLQKPRFPPKASPAAKESFAGEVPPRQGRTQGQPRNSGESAKLDSPSSLPQKDGKVDMAQYAKYKEGGLRQKVHQAIRDKHCIRCWSSQHLRSSCPEPAKKWEEDFNKGKAEFWGPRPKQSRPQWVKPLDCQSPPFNLDHELLFAVDLDRFISLDTASEVSIGLINI
jgi:hypothetical protein